MWDKEQTQALLTYAIANFGVFGEPILLAGYKKEIRHQNQSSYCYLFIRIYKLYRNNSYFICPLLNKYSKYHTIYVFRAELELIKLQKRCLIRMR